ncbi:MAG: DUF4340 domain-containing protein [Lachnospiraceae bacterium]|nr:DUF4340 domain-containing protein [Lachnospiraceae bacterium]
MKKSIKLIAGLLVICVLCGVYFGLRYYNQVTEEAEEAAAEGETILEVDTSTLTAISFLIDGEEVSFTRQDDETWQKDDDETFPVDGDALLTALSELSELKSLRTLTDIEDVSEYGFDDPQNLITLTDEDGEQTIINIGDNNASTGNDYLMLNEDETTVYTISTDLVSSFSDDIYDYAESEELPTLQASAIVGISVETADGGSYDLYIDDAIWMVSGVNADEDTEVEVTAEELLAGVEADADVADDLTSTLAGLSYVDFLDHNCDDFSEYGLDEPAVTLTITYEEEVESDETAADETETEEDADDEDESETETEEEVETVEKTITFYIGDTDSSGYYYVRLEGSSEVHTFSSSVVSTLLEYSAYDLVAEEEEETETETETEQEETEAETGSEEEEVGETDVETETETANEADTEMETESAEGTETEADEESADETESETEE